MPPPVRRPAAPPPVGGDGAPGGRLPEPDPAPAAAGATALGTLADLPVAGLTRRRIALALGALVAAWVIVLFARQVGEASEATNRAERMRESNARLAADVTALEQELELIQRQAYIEQQAREYRLGQADEIPFVLADDAPPLPPDAPGMPATRIGATARATSPIDAWLDLLFGPVEPGGNPFGEPVATDPPTPAPSG